MKVNDIGLIIEEREDDFTRYPERQGMNIAKLTEYIKSMLSNINILHEEIIELKNRIECLERGRVS